MLASFIQFPLACFDQALFFNQHMYLFLLFYGHKLAENIKLTTIGYIRSQKVIVSPG